MLAEVLGMWSSSLAAHQRHDLVCGQLVRGADIPKVGDDSVTPRKMAATGSFAEPCLTVYHVERDFRMGQET